MKKKLMPLTNPERRYLRALLKLEVECGYFTHRKLCDLFGWKSVQASFDKMRSLKRKGHIDQHGERLAFVACPVLTSKGRKAAVESRTTAAVRERITKRAA